MAAVQETIDQVKSIDVTEYKYGFVTELEVEKPAKGLTEDTVRYISARKNEPEWMLEWRLDAFRRWKTMTEPTWSRVHYPPIDYQDIYYYAAPKKGAAPKSLDEVDPAILETYKKLGIPLREQEILAGVAPENRVAVDAVFDSVSVVTTFKEELAKAGVIRAADPRAPYLAGVSYEGAGNVDFALKAYRATQRLCGDLPQHRALARSASARCDALSNASSKGNP